MQVPAVHSPQWIMMFLIQLLGINTILLTPLLLTCKGVSSTSSHGCMAAQVTTWEIPSTTIQTPHYVYVSLLQYFGHRFFSLDTLLCHFTSQRPWGPDWTFFSCPSTWKLSSLNIKGNIMLTSFVSHHSGIIVYHCLLFDILKLKAKENKWYKFHKSQAEIGIQIYNLIISTLILSYMIQIFRILWWEHKQSISL